MSWFQHSNMKSLHFINPERIKCIVAVFESASNMESTMYGHNIMGVCVWVYFMCRSVVVYKQFLRSCFSRFSSRNFSVHSVHIRFGLMQRFFCSVGLERLEFIRIFWRWHQFLFSLHSMSYGLFTFMHNVDVMATFVSIASGNCYCLRLKWSKSMQPSENNMRRAGIKIGTYWGGSRDDKGGDIDHLRIDIANYRRIHDRRIPSYKVNGLLMLPI